MLLEVVVSDVPFELIAELALAKDDEPGVGDFLDHQVRGVDEVTLTFVRHERGHVANDGSAVR